TIDAVVTATALLLIGDEAAAANLNPPLPRPRPVIAMPSPVGTAVAPDSDPACTERLASIAKFQSVAPINGPGACQAQSVVRLLSVETSDAAVIKVSPPAVLRCGMAERFAYWIRLISEAARQDTETVLTAVNTATSFDCRGQNH